MISQGFYGTVIACQFGLSQRGVNFIVANLMEQHDRAAFATLQLGHQMVEALTRLGRNRSIAKWADRILHACLRP